MYYKSALLIKHYAEDLGFKYMTASDKDGVLEVAKEFVSGRMAQPMLLEIFTDSKCENEALHQIQKPAYLIAVKSLRTQFVEQ